MASKNWQTVVLANDEHCSECNLILLKDEVAYYDPTRSIASCLSHVRVIPASA